MADIGLRVREARLLDLDDVKWHLGPFGKCHVRFGKGARGPGPKERMVRLLNGADRMLRWYVGTNVTPKVGCRGGAGCRALNRLETLHWKPVPTILACPTHCLDRPGSAVAREAMDAGRSRPVVAHAPGLPGHTGVASVGFSAGIDLLIGPDANLQILLGLPGSDTLNLLLVAGVLWVTVKIPSMMSRFV